MLKGYYIYCPNCDVVIEEFSYGDEWFCDCGESGILSFSEEDGEE